MSPIPTNRARIFRRRFSLEAPPGAYDDVEALNPTMFLQLRYPIYRGEQVLFQDAACTTPVEVAGQDTIGGVKNPFTGAIIATQPAAAARPMWEGPTVGATFDGNDFLVLESFTQPTTDATVLGRGKPVALTIHTFAATRDAATTTEGGFQLALRDNTDPLRFQWVVNDQSANQDVLRVNSSVTRGVSSHFGAVLDSAATENRVYLDGSEIATDSASVGSIESSGDQFFVGANSFDNTVPAINFWDGTIEWVSIHDAALTPTEINSTVDDGTTVDVRQITDWADAGTGTVDGELLLLTNSSNQDAIFQWDEAGSEWELVSTFDTSFDADSTVDANLYPTDFRGTQNFRNPIPTVAGALAAWDFRYDDLAVGDAYSSVTDLIGSLDASQGTTSQQPAKGTQSGYPGEYAVFDGSDIMDAGTVSSFNSVHEGDGFIMVAAQFRDINTRNDILGSSDGSSDVGIQLLIVSSVIRFRVSDGSGSYPDSFAVEQSTSVLTNDTWATIGVSWEGTTAKWWIDGVQQGSDITITSARATGDADHPLHIGGFGGTTTEMDGDLASVFISNGGHPSTAEVAALHDWMLGA